MTDGQVRAMRMTLKPGDEIGPITKQVTLDRVRLFYGESEKNIHTDEAAAREVGLTGLIAPGLMSGAFLSEMLAAFFGKSWLTGGRIVLSFIGLVSVGDTITARGVIREITEGDSGVAISLEVWCENQAGSKVVVGTASAVLASDA